MAFSFDFLLLKFFYLASFSSWLWIGGGLFLGGSLNGG